MKKIGVIGSGFSSLAAAAFLAKAGNEVHVFEKNERFGGRCSKFETDGFLFDMGPSWYWMPEVFENFFKSFGKSPNDFYELKRLDPSYEVVFGPDDKVAMPADYEALKQLFESMEPGSGAQLDKFLEEAEYKYKVGMQEFVWKPGNSIMEFADLRVLTSLFKLDMLTSVATVVDRMFKDSRIRKILKFPVLFLGATPEKTPALYTLMNYADLKLGTWYPIGGMHKIIEGMMAVCKDQGVKFYSNAEVISIGVNDGVATNLQLKDQLVDGFDYIVSGADYHHTEQRLLDKTWRTYDEAYWDKRTMAPSSLLFYIGLNTQLKDATHHTLFFDRDFSLHAHEIYEDAKWPTDPLFYMCAPSVTDHLVAPEGHENIFLLMPLAPGIEDNEQLREAYFTRISDRLSAHYGLDFRSHIVFKKSFCINDFEKDYFAYKGNAYGLANTLKQTAFLKPKIKSKKVKNLYFTGQLTSPGPGMPPSIISGEVVAKMITS
ncbi:MAG: phytoene desaturase [Saprospiraceae bacterium]|nr:phytoene desaturase [Saprospiraceae bacterium]